MFCVRIARISCLGAHQTVVARRADCADESRSIHLWVRENEDSPTSGLRASCQGGTRGGARGQCVERRAYEDIIGIVETWGWAVGPS